MTDNTAELVAMLASKDAIRELTAHYARGVIFGDGEALAARFTEDGAVIAGEACFRGRRAIADFINGLPRDTLLPMIHNHTIELDGDNASGRCIVHSPIGPDGGAGFAAEYDDSYRRVGGTWLFHERRINMIRTGL